MKLSKNNKCKTKENHDYQRKFSHTLKLQKIQYE